MIFIDLNTQNILVPWIYLFYNEDFNSVSRLIIRLKFSIAYHTPRERYFKRTN